VSKRNLVSIMALTNFTAGMSVMGLLMSLAEYVELPAWENWLMGFYVVWVIFTDCLYCWRPNGVRTRSAE
jgi:hypothetical protein